MRRSKTVLIIDDSVINRQILGNILCGQYNVIELESAKAALKLLEEKAGGIDAVLLDLVMPEMDGYEFLKIITAEERYKNLPVIVTTGSGDRESERNVLRLGAWDFVTKPYDRDIILFRLKNAIDRSQLTVFNQLKYLAEHDVLTGIYNRNQFFERTSQMLAANREQAFMFIRFDIDRFQLINSFFGNEEGDRFLKHVAAVIRSYAERSGFCTYGRIEADVFGACMPFHGEAEAVETVRELREAIADYELKFSIMPVFGIYIIDDIELPVGMMYDRANLAAKKCKGNFVKFCSFYTSDMSDSIMKEQTIINEMNGALLNEEFCLYFQPKYELKSKTPRGGEVLVRWRHPKQGIITPGDFIPVFESNGFISNLDTFIWEHACAFLRKWMDAGNEPYPISVNVSRVDVYNPKLVDIIVDITDKYRIPHELLNLEITESAYIDNPVVIKEAVKRLQKLGLVIMMDDFGSGYSSLNILKDIEVDVLKIDMNFLSDTQKPGRGENIIASVVRMAKWLNIPVVAEGVETAEQVKFLTSIGCEYAQGYYFARPMPSEEYEKLIGQGGVFVGRSTAGGALDADSIWSSHSEIAEMFENVVCAHAVYEFDGDNPEIIRVNNAFYELFGYDGLTATMDNIEEKYRKDVLAAFRRAIKEPAVCSYMYNVGGGKSLWVQVELRYIADVGKKHIFIGSFTEVSEAGKI